MKETDQALEHSFLCIFLEGLSMGINDETSTLDLDDWLKREEFIALFFSFFFCLFSPLYMIHELWFAFL